MLNQRPLSPHLTIYKPQISSVLSILHRISGVALFVGYMALCWWITYVIYVPDPLDHEIWRFFSTMYGKVILIIWSYSLFFHFCTGIRHLFWECGLCFSISCVNKTGWFAVISSIILTAVVWYLALREVV